MNHQKFGKRVQELLRQKGLRQADLADYLHITPAFLSQILKAERSLLPDRAKGCILYLAQEGAILESGYVYELIELAGCEDFSPTDWISHPLKDLIPSDAAMAASSISQQRVLPSIAFDKEAARHKYLESVLHWYQSLTFPPGSQKSFHLQDVFQSLQLRRETWFAEDLPYEDRRALLDEPTRGEDDPRWAGSGYGALSANEEGGQRSRVAIATDGFDALSRSPQHCIVILGPPGMGKTTLLRHLIVETAQKALMNQAEKIPLFVSLPDFVNADTSFQKYLVMVTGTLGIDTSYADELWQAIEQGKAFVCLDMLEQVSPERRRDLITWINVHIAEPGNVCVVSSRFNDYNGGQFLPHFLEWEICSMTHPLREQLAHALLPTLSEAADALPPSLDPSAFVRALETHPYAVNWGYNPLLFSLAASLFLRTEKLPSSRAVLYRETTEALLAARQTNRNKQVALRMIIAALALQLYKEQRRLLTREELVARLAEIAIPQQEIDATEIAQSIINSGILETVAKDLYGFWHQTFQEYFAAVDLARRLVDQKMKADTWELAWQKHTASRWREVLQLMVGILLLEYKAQGGVEIAQSWLRALIEQGTQTQGDIGDVGLALALHTLSDIGALASSWNSTEREQLEERVVHAWVTALVDATEHDHTVRQRRLLQLTPDLCQLKPSTIALLVQLLENHLSSWDTRIRVAVIKTFGQLGAFVPIAQVVKMLGDLHRDVRAATVQALIQLEEHVPIDELRVALKNQSAMIREETTRVLGAMKQPLLVEELEENLHDKEWSVRLATVEALGNVGEQFRSEKLLANLHDEDSFVRRSVVEALGKQDNDAHLELFLALLDDPDDGVRAAAIEVLGERAPLEKLLAEVVSPLGATFLNFHYAQRAAEAVLAKRGEQALLKAMISVGMPDNSEVRELVQSIVESQQETPQDELLDILHGNDAERRGLAANILSRKDKALLEQEILSQATRNNIVRAIALRMVGKLGEQELVKQALLGLRDPDAKVRLSAVEALRDLGAQIPTEATAVTGCIEDEDWLIRTGALQVLALVTQQVRVTVSLVESLLWLASEEKYKPAQDAAKQCLERLGGRISKQLFDALVHHEEPETRVATLQYLWQHIPMQQIQEALSDNDEGVRDAATMTASQRKTQSVWRRMFKTRGSQQKSIISMSVEHLVEAQLLRELCGEESVQQIMTTREVQVEDVGTWNPQIWSTHGPGEKPLVVVNTDEAMDPFSKAQIDLEEEIHEQILQLLKKQASREGLLAALKNEHPAVRLVALQALGERAPEEQLLAALYDENVLVRREALQHLGMRTPHRQLLYALHDHYEDVREAALELLRKSVQRLPEHELLEALEDENAIKRLSAIQALGKHAPIEKLLAMLGDSSEEVRLASLDMLLHAHPETRPRIISELMDILVQKKLGIMIESAGQSFLLEIIRHIEEPMTPRMYDKLIELLNWPYWEVQAKAARVLATIHQNIPAEAIERLFELRKNSVTAVRIAVDDALAELLSLDRGFEAR